MLATKIYVGAMLNIQNDKYFDGFCYDVSKTLVNPKKNWLSMKIMHYLQQWNERKS